MSDYFHVPLGVPVNPLFRAPMDTLLPQGYRPPQFLPEIPPPPHQRPTLDRGGIDVGGGVSTHSLPEIMTVPEPVSALDPAFSMHPIVQALGRRPGVPVPAPSQQSAPGSPMQQLPLSQKRGLSRTQLLTALGLPGLDWGQQTQGQAY
jgi:hypothetical protein